MKKAFKDIAIMLAIILICGGLLALLSDLLYVDDNERIQRAIDKIYIEEEVSLKHNLKDKVANYSDNSDVGMVKSAYLLDNGDYLVLVTGKKGYSNGTVTIYASICNDNGVATVKNTVQDSYTGQTLMSKLTSIYEKFTGKNSTQSNEEVTEIVSGATYSSTAASNAVIVALDFVQTQIGG